MVGRVLNIFQTAPEAERKTGAMITEKKVSILAKKYIL
jgi:hypothetical protein